MIIAGILFLIGLLIGLSRGYPAILLASAAVTLIAFPTWIIRGALPEEKDDLPEPDRPLREEAQPRPPQDGEAGPEQDRGE
jgi:hypothetical protein